MTIFQLVKEHPLKFAISILVSLALVWYSFKDLEWASFWETILSVDYLILAAAGGVLVYSNVIRAARWRILLSPQKDIRTGLIFESVMMGYLGNNVLPFKLGEVLRAVVVSRRHHVPVSGVGTTVVVERGLDMFSFFLVAGTYALFAPAFQSANILAALGLISLLAVVILGFWVNRHHDRFEAKVAAWSQSMRDKGQDKRAEHLRSIFKGLETIWRMPQPLAVLGQTMFLWFLYLMVTYLGLVAFDFGLTAGELLQVSIMLLIFTTFSLAIPAAPGYVGTYHSAVLIALSLFAIPDAEAMTFAIVLHLMNYLIYTPLGAMYLIKAGMSVNMAGDQDALE